MFKKYTKLHFLILISFTVLFACKKEVEGEAKQFGVLNVENQTTYTNLKLNYNDLSGVTLNPGVNKDIKIPSGTGKLSFLDLSNKLLLETTFSVENHKVKNLLLFQPTPELKPVILENSQAEEPKPEKNYIKVKAANFASHAFPKSIDIVFYQEDPDTFDVIATDTLENVAPGFVDFKKLAVIQPYYAGMDIIDSETKQSLTSRQVTINLTGKSIFTIYIVEDPTNGIPVNNSPYKISIKVLFAN